MIKSILLTLILSTFNVTLGLAQIGFQISNYDGYVKGAGKQNWDISKDENHKIYVANNFGLLVLENTNVTLHQLPNQTIFRSVEYIDGKIFTGSFEDFGYWTSNADGQLSYTSLVQKLENSNMNNDEIWKIIEHKGVIYFHSFGSIYTYDGTKVARLSKNASFMFPHKVHGKVFFQKIQGGLFELINGALVSVPSSNFLKDEEVKSIIELENNRILIGTTLGLYVYDGVNFKTWDVKNQKEIVQNNINVMLRTNDKIVIGTILSGLYIYDLDFNFLEHIDTEKQLQNNTVLSLEEDVFGNIWVGMDNGLSYISFDSPIHTHKDKYKGIGSSYTAALYNDELYVGTNQGIYVYEKDSTNMFYSPFFIPSSQGQVWFLKEFNDKLYAGTNDGTYIIENKSLQKVSENFGGYTLKPYFYNNLNVLLQSTYSDVLVYKKEFNNWSVSDTLRGFSTPARYMEFDHLGNIWLGHTVKGIYKLQPNIQLDSIADVKRIGAKEGLNISNNRVFKLDNRIVTSYQDTLFEWDTIDEKFVPYTELDAFFTEVGTVNNIIPAGNQRYWVIKQSEISLFEIRFDSIRLVYRLLPEMHDFSLVNGYETVIPLTENLHLICLDEGFAILDLDQINQENYIKPSTIIQEVKASDSNFNKYSLNPTHSTEVSISNQNNNIEFKWTTSQIVGDKIFFQYKLEGLENEWNAWTTKTSVSYDRLEAGQYSFLVRSIDKIGLVTDTTSYSFIINEPWYLTKIAYFFYSLIFVLLGFMARLYVSRKRWQAHGKELEKKNKKAKREQEKAEREIIKLNNEKLQSEVEHKSAQLASNTMAIMRKNNLLSSLKDELLKQKKELGTKMPSKYFTRLNKLIEQGIEDEHEWEVFEQLYDQAHGDFFKRLKEKYPQLTPSDLRLCAYLRMNLASKEIAPLLNISVRGVEERRYRLRKRLDITTDTNLTELIMTF